VTWLLTLLPIGLILWLHFRGQTSESRLKLASNFWLIFYVTCYFIPIPLFVLQEDGWSTIWGYAFNDFDDSLNKAVLLATAGGILLSLCARGYRPIRVRVTKAAAKKPSYIPDNTGLVSNFRIFLVFSIVLTSLLYGVYLLGGTWVLLEGLGDRIKLFAGLNTFFLPVNMLIGVCFAISAARVLGQQLSWWKECILIAITLLALSVLGQKSNIFIFLVGLIIIKYATVRRINLWLLVLVGFIFVNLLLFYEFIFREALIVGINQERLTLKGWASYAFVQITGNFMQIQNLALLVDAMPENLSYTFGDTYLAIFLLVIPQQFIEVKPLTAAGVHTLAFWPEVVARESTTMPPGLFGEAYINFGLLGFIFCCIFVGLLLRYVDSTWRQRRDRTIMKLVLVATVGASSLHFIRGEFFAPILIVIGILVGARAAVIMTPRSQSTK
jgi:oligosaccharide repeat unit polymerase